MRNPLLKIQRLLCGLAICVLAIGRAIADTTFSDNPFDLFSFSLDAKTSREFLSGWKIEKTTYDATSTFEDGEPFSAPLKQLKRVDVTTYSDAALRVTFEREVFPDDRAYVQGLTFGANVEGSALIADVWPLDTVIALEGDGPITLHYAKGSHNEQTDFQPMEAVLEPGKPISFMPYGGRSSDGYLPYFNVASTKGGVIIGIGWTGQWKATFEAIDAGHVRIRAGMEQTRIRLHDNDWFESPAIFALKWSGDEWLVGQNELRRFMLRYFTPQQNGKPIVPPIAASPHVYIGFNDTTEANLLDCIQRIAAHKLPIDTFWLDAGWNTGGFPRGMGNPDPDPSRFPNGLRPIADAAHAQGWRYLQWFEPERVMTGTWLEREHPDWLLSPTGLPSELAYHANDGFKLLNLDKDAAFDWITQKVSSQLSQYGIDIYRQDFNMCPLYYWRNREADDRQGMNEFRYINGLYSFLDTLRENNPNIVIDNCASGGRRLDFEMMRRSLALWRSDNCWEPIGEQCMTYGLSLWLPLHGVGSVSLDPYDFRSGMGSCFSLALDYRSEDPKFWEQATTRLSELAKVRAFFSKDFYPLMPYTTSDDAWIAWQFHDPEMNAGIVQAFRRGKSESNNQTVKLHGLDKNSRYAIVNLDSAEETIATGASLSDGVVPVSIEHAPGSALLLYSRIVN